LYYRNGLNTTLVYDLPLNSEVLVWRESGNWTGPYCLLAVENETYCIQLPSGLTSFRSTSVKPYFWSKNTHDVELDELKAPAELDELEAPLLTLEVPCKLTELTKPAVKRG
jgi:hypothetical protein